MELGEEIGIGMGRGEAELRDNTFWSFYDHDLDHRCFSTSATPTSLSTWSAMMASDSFAYRAVGMFSKSGDGEIGLVSGRARVDTGEEPGLQSQLYLTGEAAVSPRAYLHTHTLAHSLCLRYSMETNDISLILTRHFSPTQACHTCAIPVPYRCHARAMSCLYHACATPVPS